MTRCANDAKADSKLSILRVVIGKLRHRSKNNEYLLLVNVSVHDYCFSEQFVLDDSAMSLEWKVDAAR